MGQVCKFRDFVSFLKYLFLVHYIWVSFLWTGMAARRDSVSGFAERVLAADIDALERQAEIPALV
ncbi:hypothetical protein HOLleu_44250 [Holothuria leucospilota]|uniref:Uncharacterized protein n=1 Tax=Holothuria leucospilota TaxID=206669 RepID=A0A9Q0YB23_HOLLE|nr:hypothetical protein HOLleu_44250 [Holothuria leucospilota]